MHEQRDIIQALDTVIASKKAESYSLETAIQGKKRRMEEPNEQEGRKRKRVKASEVLAELSEELEDVSQSTNCNENSANQMEESVAELKDDLDALKEMLDSMQNLL